jgi:hypothetical protein
MRIEFEGVRKVYLLKDDTLILHLFDALSDVTFCGEQIINGHFDAAWGRNEKCTHCMRRLTNLIPYGTFLNG